MSDVVGVFSMKLLLDRKIVLLVLCWCVLCNVVMFIVYDSVFVLSSSYGVCFVVLRLYLWLSVMMCIFLLCICEKLDVGVVVI